MNRVDALRRLLGQGKLSTQDELREELKREDFDVTQSTISRDLRRIGAVKATAPDGRTVYRLPDEAGVPVTAGSLRNLINEIVTNGSIIVIHTPPGSASLVARHLDRVKPGGILGTLAGDDTIFVAPAATGRIKATITAIETTIAEAP